MAKLAGATSSFLVLIGTLTSCTTDPSAGGRDADAPPPQVTLSEPTPAGEDIARTLGATDRAIIAARGLLARIKAVGGDQMMDERPRFAAEIDAADHELSDLRLFPLGTPKARLDALDKRRIRLEKLVEAMQTAAISPRQAIDILTLPAELGSEAAAIYLVGFAIATGKPMNLATLPNSLAFFRREADKGQPMYQFMTATFLVMNGKGAFNAEVNSRLQQCADGGDPSCQQLLGTFYAKGVAGVTDDQKASVLLEKAAKQGSPEAQKLLDDVRRRMVAH